MFEMEEERGKIVEQYNELVVEADKEQRLKEEAEAKNLDDARQSWWLTALLLKVKQGMMDKMEQDQKMLRAEFDQKEAHKVNIYKEIEKKQIGKVNRVLSIR